MGDCGAMFLGFLLAAVSIKTSYQSTTANAIFVPILALGLPIIDHKMKSLVNEVNTIAAISRRLCSLRSVVYFVNYASEASILRRQKAHSP